MSLSDQDRVAIEKLKAAAREVSMDISGMRIRRTSSRFCFGVEHGDYNGTELFGIGTDRFIWMAYKPSGSAKSRLFSANFPDDAVVEFSADSVPEPRSAVIADTWGRYPLGVTHVLREEGLAVDKGIDAIVYGNIPGGGMSRSASLCINLILAMMDVNNVKLDNEFRIVELAQAVENVYIGSPCGLLDQIMIYFAKEGMGTHYNPTDGSIQYVPLGADAMDFRIVVMDTGTVRPGLEKSTYKVRRSECEEFAAMLGAAGYPVKCLADVRDGGMYEKILRQFGDDRPGLCGRFRYIYHAQERFYEMLDAWKRGDIETLGAIFRQDGIGLRDDYAISGPELETMCDIVRTVPGVLGERMLGGGDKGAAGAIVRADAVDAVRTAVDCGYPRSRPGFADRYALHVCRPVGGVTMIDWE
ncbi:MAG: hypothetical protein JW936_01385 [Sedimentisphaerales bacterium]|nr:hypothetical protein [Sedimentisphaerales bacterium]